MTGFVAGPTTSGAICAPESFHTAVSQIAMQDSVTSRNLVSFVQRAGWSITHGPCAIDHTLERIYEESIAEPDEDKPTHFAMDTARELLQNAKRYLLNAISPNVIEGSEGDLILHWEIGGKGAALVFPAWADRPVRLYTEELEHGVPKRRSMVDSPETPHIVAMFRWLEAV